MVMSERFLENQIKLPEEPPANVEARQMRREPAPMRRKRPHR